VERKEDVKVKDGNIHDVVIRCFRPVQKCLGWCGKVFISWWLWQGSAAL